MPKDLSKVSSTASAVYMEVIPFLEALNNITYLTDEDKKEHAIDFTVEILNKAKPIEDADPKEYQLYREYITKARNIMSTKDDVKQIIYYMNCTIKAEKGN